jgi:hypothetical protein
MTLRCPMCFCKNLRQGEGLIGPHDRDTEIRSFDFNILQCMECGWSGDESRFKPPQRGLAVISPWTEVVISGTV